MSSYTLTYGSNEMLIEIKWNVGPRVMEITSILIMPCSTLIAIT